jgi:hypothetical protein
MKKIVVASYLLIALTLLLVIPVNAAAKETREIIKNGGFEAKFNKWSYISYSEGSVDVVTSDPHSGKKSCLIVGNLGIQQFFKKPVPVENVYSITFWVKCGVSVEACDLLYSDDTYNEYMFGCTNEWSQVDVTSELETGKELVGIRLFGYYPPVADPTYYDYISILVTK